MKLIEDEMHMRSRCWCVRTPDGKLIQNSLSDTARDSWKRCIKEMDGKIDCRLWLQRRGQIEAEGYSCVQVWAIFSRENVIKVLA